MGERKRLPVLSNAHIRRQARQMWMAKPDREKRLYSQAEWEEDFVTGWKLLVRGWNERVDSDE